MKINEAIEIIKHIQSIFGCVGPQMTGNHTKEEHELFLDKAYKESAEYLIKEMEEHYGK